MQFGVLCYIIWIFFTMMMSHSLSRDDSLAYRELCSCTLDRNVWNLISQLQLRRRGCRAGARYRQRQLGAVTSLTSVNSTAHAADAREILTVIGSHRPNRNANKPRDVRECVLKPVRRFSAQKNETDLTLQTTEYIPSLYLLNAAALSKPYATEHLAADLNGYKSDIAVITETHFKAKHSDGAVEIAGL